MDNNNNIIVFPKNNIQSLTIETKEDVDENIDNVKHYHIDETISMIAPYIFRQAENAGFNLCEDETTLKDGAFIIESIRSFLYKSHNLYHPFQVIAETVFSDEQDDEGTLRIADSLNVELKQKEVVK